jgi:hypothetical protein
MRRGITVSAKKIGIWKAGVAALGAAVTLGLAAAATGLAEAATQGRPEAASPGRMYGNPAAAAPHWKMQSLDDCALMASADVIEQLLNREVSEQEVIALAQGLPSRVHYGAIYTLPSDMSRPNQTGHGTNPQDIPVLLARYGINAVYTSEQEAERTGVATGLEALEHYLGGGHKVIVGLNAELLWGQPVVTKDRSGNPLADHAVVVTGVNTANGTVHLDDSGSASGKDETVPIAVFVKSWATGSDQMVVTEQTS